MAEADIRQIVREKYGEAARRVIELKTATSCCGPAPAPAPATSCCAPAPTTSCCSSGPLAGTDPITRDLYDSIETGSLPEAAVLASLGCGNPTALADLAPGEVVLDLGSGGGIDVLLSARRVGPTGKAYGLDMTDDMLALANENKRKAGATNVEFLKGEIEHIPLPDASVDVIISNCVINLSADKDQVLREAFRVLRPGGRFAVSDVVTRGEIRPEIRASVLAWVGCVAGALDEDDYRARLARAGFVDVDVEPTRIYTAEDAREFLAANGLDTSSIGAEIDGRFLSAFIRARKPGG